MLRARGERDLNFAPTSGSQVVIRYLRVANSGCSIPKSGEICWIKLQQQTGLAHSPMPKCSDYEGKDAGTAASVIAYPVEVSLFPKPSIRPLGGPFRCYPTEWSGPVQFHDCGRIAYTKVTRRATTAVQCCHKGNWRVGHNPRGWRKESGFRYAHRHQIAPHSFSFGLVLFISRDAISESHSEAHFLLIEVSDAEVDGDRHISLVFAARFQNHRPAVFGQTIRLFYMNRGIVDYPLRRKRTGPDFNRCVLWAWVANPCGHWDSLIRLNWYLSRLDFDTKRMLPVDWPSTSELQQRSQKIHRHLHINPYPPGTDDRSKAHSAPSARFSVPVESPPTRTLPAGKVRIVHHTPGSDKNGYQLLARWMHWQNRGHNELTAFSVPAPFCDHPPRPAFRRGKSLQLDLSRKSFFWCRRSGNWSRAIAICERSLEVLV